MQLVLVMLVGHPADTVNSVKPNCMRSLPPFDNQSSFGAWLLVGKQSGPNKWYPRSPR